MDKKYLLLMQTLAERDVPISSVFGALSDFFDAYGACEPEVCDGLFYSLIDLALDDDEEGKPRATH